MGCNCNNKNTNGDCGCGCQESAQQFDRVYINDPCQQNQDAASANGCQSTRGYLYDRITEQFTVPAVGKEAYLHVCEANRWQVGQFVAVNLGGNKIAAFKITKRGNKKLLVLNGCDKSGVNAIFGNPDVGSIIPNDSVIYPIAPTGCESDLAAKIIETLTQFGTDAVIDLISKSSSFCLTNIPEISEDEDLHLFGGTKPDCDCAPEGFISSCFRKLLKIITGNAGRTLCFPEIPETNTSPVGGVAKRLALFDNNQCLKKGPTIEEFQSCGSFPEASSTFTAISVCDNGASKTSKAIENGSLFSTVVTEEGEDVVKWENRLRRYAIVEYSTSGSTSGGTATKDDWFTRPLNKIKSQSGSLVTLTSNEITINQPGRYLVRFFCSFMNTEDSQCRLINSESSGEVYYGSCAFSNELAAGAFADTKSHGFAAIEVLKGTTKKFKLEYRVEVTKNNDGLGRVPNFATETIYAQVELLEL